MTTPRNAPGERSVLATRGRHVQKMGPEANSRLTASTAIVLLILLAIEGLTVVRVRPLLTVHVFVGMLLIPPVLVKLSSTIWRFAKYYLGSSDYRHKGPPPLVLRLLGPVVALLTIVLFASGVLALLGPVSLRSQFLLFHKVSFFLWFACMTVHVLGHLGETAKLGTKDWTSRARRAVVGSKIRRQVLSASLIVGLILSFVTIPHVGPWIAGA
jgi:hypothetical protein